MQNALKEGRKGFGRGFCDCLAAWVASVLLIIPLILILTTVLGPVIGGLLQGLPGPIAPLMPPWGLGILLPAVLLFERGFQPRILQVPAIWHNYS